MFSGLRSNSVALSHVWLDFPGDPFQPESQQCLHGDGLHHNFKCRSVTMLENGGQHDTAVTSA